MRANLWIWGGGMLIVSILTRVFFDFARFESIVLSLLTAILAVLLFGFLLIHDTLKAAR